MPGAYALGNGHRSFNPAMMRFISPDTLSPFGKGGINAYCYCACDPVNNVDPSGRMKRMQRPPARTTRSAPSANFISLIKEPDVFSRIIKHLDLDSATALSMTSKHLNNMTMPAFQKMKRSLNDPAQLFDSAFAGSVGPALGHSCGLLVRRSDLPLPAQSSENNARDQFIRDIVADKQFRQAQRGRSPSIDSSSASDSDDEIQRVNRGIRKALDGPQL